MGKRESHAAPAPALEAPERFVWDSPGGEVRILMDREAAERLREAARTSAAGGLLIGESSDEPSRVVTIRGVEPLAWSLGMDEEERGRFENAVKAAGANGRAVGYYRAQPSQELFLNASDLVLMKSFFPEPARIFLLLKRTPAGNPATRFFFWDSGLLRPGWTEAGAPFGRPLGAGEELPPAGIPEPEPALVEPPEDAPRRRPRRRWAWAAAAVLLAAGLIAALRFTPAIPQARAWLAPAPTSAAPARLAFALDVEKKLGDLALTWDRSAPAIERAVRAVLFIRDGAAERSYDVDLTQLKTGMVFYTPQSADVQFRLEVYSAHEALAVASARVLSAALPPPLPLPEPPPLQNTKAARPTARAEGASRAAADLHPRTLYFAYPRTPEPQRQTLAAPPLMAGAKPSASAPPAVVPNGVRVDAPVPASAPVKPAPTTPAPRMSDYVGPRVTRQVYPSVPGNLRAMLKSETNVDVKVGIDETGKVDRAAVVNRRGEMASYLAETVLNTARMWRFEPARNEGRPVRSEMVLNFRFTR